MKHTYIEADNQKGARLKNLLYVLTGTQVLIVFKKISA